MPFELRSRDAIFLKSLVNRKQLSFFYWIGFSDKSTFVNFVNVSNTSGLELKLLLLRSIDSNDAIFLIEGGNSESLFPLKSSRTRELQSTFSNVLSRRHMQGPVTCSHQRLLQIKSLLFLRRRSETLPFNLTTSVKLRAIITNYYELISGGATITITDNAPRTLQATRAGWKT